MAFRKTLYKFQKGKQMQANGSWKLNKKEDLAVKAISLCFAVSTLTFLLSSFFHIKILYLPSLICLVVSFIGMFVVMFGLVFLKARKEPMEKHYYDVDYKYNGIRNEVEDKTREITKEEFLAKEKQE